MSENLCVCGSGIARDTCCGPYLDGHAQAPDATTLMRSRYSAYVEANTEYLQSTWYPDTRPEGLQAETPGLVWKGLHIEASGGEGGEAWVIFTAQLQQNGVPGSLREKSLFRRAADGHWYYLDGDVPETPVSVVKVGRNEPCPCGSGRKYKRCCGA